MQVIKIMVMTVLVGGVHELMWVKCWKQGPTVRNSQAVLGTCGAASWASGALMVVVIAMGWSFLV